MKHRCARQARAFPHGGARRLACILLGAQLLGCPAGAPLAPWRTASDLAPPELGTPWRGAGLTPAFLPAEETPGIPLELASDARRLTLAELLEIALRLDPGTERAWHEARAALADWERERGRYLPRLYGNVSVVDLRAPETDGKQPPVEPVREPGIAIDYLLFDFGRRAASVEAARQVLFAANWRYDQRIQDVLLEVATAYYALLGSKALVAADEETLADARLVLRAADERLQVGTGTIVDVYQARAGVARVELDLAADRGAVQAAHGALATAMGLPANTRFEVADLPGEVPLELVREEVDRLIERARARRPELGAARAETLRHAAEVEVARSAFLPEIVAGASWNRQAPELGGPNDGAFDQYRYGIEVNVPIFEGFRRWNALRAAESRSRASDARLRGRTQAVIAEVWNAYFALATALARVRASETLLAAARESYRASLATYRSGAGDVIELLNGLAQLANARAAAVIARTDLFTSHAVLLRAIGENVRGTG